jgi:hypothetical protein
MKTAYKIFFGKLGMKRSLARYTFEWEDNIKMDLK